MSDLTKLTAEDICWWLEEVICDLTPEQKREIRRRLERLEQCEAQIRDARYWLERDVDFAIRVVGANGALKRHDAARAALEGK